jgi:hypothetical protein
MNRIFSRRFKRSSSKKAAVAAPTEKDGLRESFTDVDFEAPDFNVVHEGFDSIHVSSEKQSASQSHTNDTRTVSTPQSDQPQGSPKGADDVDEFQLSISSAEDELEISRASTMSFGTHHPDDSFVAISATGLSSDESSINSRYLDMPPARSKGSHDGDGSRRTGSDGRLKSKTTTSTLPRLTINTRQTMALLASDSPDVEKKMMNQSMTPRTVGTEPMTPVFHGTRQSDEFPVQADISSTPQIHLPSSLQTSRDDSNFSSSVDTKVTPRKRANKTRRVALVEKEYWDLRLKEIIFQHGANSIQAAKGMGNLGASLLRCKVRICNILIFLLLVRCTRFRALELSLS